MGAFPWGLVLTAAVAILAAFFIGIPLWNSTVGSFATSLKA
jgi:hypothetical protein